MPDRRPVLTLVPRGGREPLLRHLVGRVLRDERTTQARTLADVAHAAQVSLPYLSEVERGRKEPSSEVLAAICRALDLSIVDVLRRGSSLATSTSTSTRAGAGTRTRTDVRLSLAA